ncbi:Hypothetical protein I596_2132 [Dokdonella koreensis DS-123]|uniref:Uncharacterized protein n=1 Tax=Dokdonella koreensis DS-123 TaxID=1300342 RepID=A0A160DVK2_9GAMM|nr:Hypothetical protein I596_2132 [Dokdonella koreensis DS-123]
MEKARAPRGRPAGRWRRSRVSSNPLRVRRDLILTALAAASLDGGC